ncbi:DUF459 domain-containing protein [Halobacillus karajensis]|uniref:Spore germination lipase LipC n=1 Tax=Halobacillus karajensis TaxID=195088 RepID=A0A024P795_9BACI|nr:GDSL-type esterase/lipase family protein [Halobacillus karajensis]CDQ17786.1 Spore germination lipase LipC [Halobacillus karajensis]CDQ24192.1 Spore germination lipase LipC [Halobacillus karajensis]CDQ29559.1 Spore germination lipase LipC [Halobacillus karajensis]
MKRHQKWWIGGLLIIAVGWGVFGFRSSMSHPEEKKIVALGDSLTFGVGDESGHGYVENLQQWLDRHYEGDTTVDNHAIPGQQSDGLLNQMKEASVFKSVENADYILLYIGMNDILKSNGGDLAPLNERQLSKGKKDYENNLKQILDRIREKNPTAPVLFLGLFNPYPDKPEIGGVITSWNHLSESMVQNYDDVTFIETNDLFEEKSTRYFSDAVHLNEKGYEKLTKRIIEAYHF